MLDTIVQRDFNQKLLPALAVTEDSSLTILGEVLANKTLLAAVTYLKLFNASATNIELMREFLQDLHNCSLGELKTAAEALLEEYQSAFNNFQSGVQRFREGLQKYAASFQFDRKFVK